MTLFGLDLLTTLRQRFRAVLAAFAGSAACCLCGALMAFVFAPAQALEAYRISRLPAMDAATVEAAAPGEAILITGVLADNAPVLEDAGFVAYYAEEWEVTVPSDVDGEGEPRGSWKTVELIVPGLNLDVGGQFVIIREANNVRLAGPLHETTVPGEGLTATYDGKPLPDGTRRYRGLSDGDLATVLGKKEASGGVTPEQIFAGDRGAFEKSQQDAASGLLFSGICSMILAPFVLIGGLLGAVFRRRR
jgi:hypothetical protein